MTMMEDSEKGIKEIWATSRLVRIKIEYDGILQYPRSNLTMRWNAAGESDGFCEKIYTFFECYRL